MKFVLSRMHPLACLTYLTAVLTMIAVRRHPWVLGTQLICLLGIDLFYGRKVRTLFLAAGMILAAAICNGWFVQRGMTVLFTAAGRRISLEALLYGANAGILLVNVCLLFSLLNRCFHKEHWVYLFGTVFPHLGVVFSMALGLIPKYRRQAEDMMHARKNLCEESAIRRVLTVTSMELTWVFESSMDQLDSMNARGYGVGSRSHFHLFHFGRKDGIYLTAVLLLFGVNLYGYWKFYSDFYFYPVIQWSGLETIDMLFIAAAGLQILFPAFFYFMENFDPMK